MSDLTEVTRRRYDRLAAVYDLRESGVEQRLFAAWRRRLWCRVQGPRVLEVGVGTGKNMPYYPPGMQITAIDLSPGMLSRARLRAEELGIAVDLREMDVEHLQFPDASFDTAIDTFVFCSVPDPIQGLRELRRVVRPGGQVLLLEHVRPAHPLLGVATDLLNPLVVRAMGANINRRTVRNVRAAGLVITHLEELLAFGVFRLIEATPP